MIVNYLVQHILSVFPSQCFKNQSDKTQKLGARFNKGIPSVVMNNIHMTVYSMYMYVFIFSYKILAFHRW